jgi:hypothetical protein
MKSIPGYLIPLLVVAATASLRADFSGDYAVGSPTTYNLVSGATTDVGQWDALFSSPGGSGSVNTTSAPGSITLSVTGNGSPSFGPGSTASLAFTYTFTTSGNVSFSYSIGNAGGSFSTALDTVTQTAIGTDYSFNVSSGQTLSINLSATGTSGSSMMVPNGFGGFTFFPMPGFPVTQTVTLSNFNAPSAIPEPASFALAGGLAVLAISTLRRRRA